MINAYRIEVFPRENHDRFGHITLDMRVTNGAMEYHSSKVIHPSELEMTGLFDLIFEDMKVELKKELLRHIK